MAAGKRGHGLPFEYDGDQSRSVGARVSRPNEDRPEVIERVAESLRHRREAGIPVAELSAISEREGIWPYQVMETLGLSNQEGDIFRPKPAKEVEPNESAAIVIVPATLENLWLARLRIVIAETEADGMDWSSTFLSIAYMRGRGWPPAAWTSPATWGKANPAGRAAIALGLVAIARDGDGLSLRRS